MQASLCYQGTWRYGKRMPNTKHSGNIPCVPYSSLQDMTKFSALHSTDIKSSFSPPLSQLSTKGVAVFPLFAPATKEGNIISPTESSY